MGCVVFTRVLKRAARIIRSHKTTSSPVTVVSNAFQYFTRDMMSGEMIQEERRESLGRTFGMSLALFIKRTKKRCAEG